MGDGDEEDEEDADDGDYSEESSDEEEAIDQRSMLHKAQELAQLKINSK